MVYCISPRGQLCFAYRKANKSMKTQLDFIITFFLTSTHAVTIVLVMLCVFYLFRVFPRDTFYHFPVRPVSFLPNDWLSTGVVRMFVRTSPQTSTSLWEVSASYPVAHASLWVSVIAPFDDWFPYGQRT